MNGVIYPPLVIGAISIIFAAPLLMGKVKRNPSYGFRFKKAFESEEKWIKINKYGAKQLIIWSTLLIVTGLMPVIIPIQDRTVRLFIGLIACLLMVVSISIATYSYAKKL